MAKTTIRPATDGDIARMIELGALMHAESPRFRVHQFLPDRLADSIRAVMAMDRGFAVVAEVGGEVVGGMLAVAVPHYACDFLQASDLAYFVHPDYRGGAAAMRLVGAYQDWAARLGAEASIGLNTGVEPQRTGRLMAALGAEATGTVWTWRTACA